MTLKTSNFPYINVELTLELKILATFSNHIAVLLFQLPILVSSVVSLYFLEWTDIFKPVHWGFSCYDRSLSLPYIEPTNEVIPFLMLLILTFGAPALTVSITHIHTSKMRLLILIS